MNKQSLEDGLRKIFPFFIILAAIAAIGVLMVIHKNDSTSQAKPAATVPMPFTFGKDRDCDVIDLEPGRKLLDYTVVGEHPYNVNIYFTTRPLRADEVAVPETVIYRFSTNRNPQTGCVFIIREHAATNQSASK